MHLLPSTWLWGSDLRPEAEPCCLQEEAVQAKPVELTTPGPAHTDPPEHGTCAWPVPAASPGERGCCLTHGSSSSAGRSWQSLRAEVSAREPGPGAGLGTWTSGCHQGREHPWRSQAESSAKTGDLTDEGWQAAVERVGAHWCGPLAEGTGLAGQ